MKVYIMHTSTGMYNVLCITSNYWCEIRVGPGEKAFTDRLSNYGSVC